MKSFQFSLQAVRTVREREEQQSLQHYVKALRAVDEARRQAEAVAAELAGVWLHLQEAVSGGSTAFEVQRLHDHCDAVLLRKRDRDLALQAARDAASGAFARYLAAHQARTAVEKLFVRQRASWERTRRAQAQKMIDEIAARGLGVILSLPPAEVAQWN
jgi:flagellar export protein FliJ